MTSRKILHVLLTFPLLLGGIISPANSEHNIEAGLSTPAAQTSFGVIAFLSERGATDTRTGLGDIYVMNADGSNVNRVFENPYPVYHPTLSPDGTKIAFVSHGHIYVINIDGSGFTEITDSAAGSTRPAWSPDGKKIAFTDTPTGNFPDIFVMNADGTGRVNLTNSYENDTDPAWSPDGTKIVYIYSQSEGIVTYDNIWVMNADGSGKTQLTFNHSAEYPVWSPDGTKIAFAQNTNGWNDIFIINSDGTGEVNLTNDSYYGDSYPSWSPDGSQIAFDSYRNENVDIYKMNADGSGLTRLTDDPAKDADPSWSQGGSQSPGADLLVTVTASADSVTWGDSLTYQVTVANNGSDDANNVTIVDTLPDQVTYTSLIFGQGECPVVPSGSTPGGTIECVLASLPNGGSASMVIDVAPLNGEGILINNAAVSANEPDPNPGNNAASVSTTLVPFESPTPTMEYFALGDSIASGHGLQDDGLDCRRSVRSYPHRVIELLKTRYSSFSWTILACSGATARLPSVKTLSEDPNKWFQNQVDYVLTHLSDIPTLVSISIGVNDFGWANPGTFLIHMYVESEDDFVKWVDDVVYNPVTGVKVLVKEQVEKLLAKPNVAVVINDVHNPFNTHSHLFYPRKLPSVPCADDIIACYIRTEYAVHSLNGALLAVWQELGQPERLQISSVHERFHADGGHESPILACGLNLPGIDQTWVQYPGDLTSNSWALLPSWLRKRIPQKGGGDCFHPNDKGAQAYADAVNEDAIRLGR